MQNRELYNLLDSFLQCANMSRRRFAKLAGIPPTTLQHKFEVANALRSDMFLSIRCAMFAVMAKESNEETYETLYRIYADFQAAYLNVDYIDPIAKEIIEGEQAVHESLKHMVSEGYSPYCGGSCNLSAAHSFDEAQKRLEEAFQMLNETGRRIAAERVEELTKIADYRKDRE